MQGGEFPANEDFCKYQLADEAWQEKLQQVAKDAYLALDGSGYGRGKQCYARDDDCKVLETNQMAVANISWLVF